MAKLINVLIFFPVICIIGSLTSYEDFIISKIRNKWILIGISYAFLIYLGAWTVKYMGNFGFSGPLLNMSHYLTWNFDKWSINLFASTLIAYFLWHFKIWGAGDAKLFICYSALIPMTQYSKVYFHYYFASFFLLLAIFIPAMLPLFIRSIAHSFNRISFNSFRSLKTKLASSNKVEAAKILVGFIVLFLFLRMLSIEFQNLFIKHPPDQYVSILLFLFIFRYLSNFFKKHTRFTLTVAIFLIIYFQIFFNGSIILEIAKAVGKAALTMVLFPLFRRMIDFYFKTERRENVSFALWMFLGALIVWIFPAKF